MPVNVCVRARVGGGGPGGGGEGGACVRACVSTCITCARVK